MNIFFITRAKYLYSLRLHTQLLRKIAFRPITLDKFESFGEKEIVHEIWGNIRTDNSLICLNVHSTLFQTKR